jgi:cyanate permease
MFEVYLLIICTALFILCFFCFKKENVSLFQRDQSTFRNIIKVFKNPNGWRLVLAVSISNGCMILIGSTINIICVDQGFSSLLASVVVLANTLVGLFATIGYNLLFYKTKDHRINFMSSMLFAAISHLIGTYAIYYKIKWLFVVMFVLNGIFTFPIIPFLMEKTSTQFKEISLNVINLSRCLLCMFC